jgi:hypothetical protein
MCLILGDLLRYSQCNLKAVPTPTHEYAHLRFAFTSIRLADWPSVGGGPTLNPAL